VQRGALFVGQVPVAGPQPPQGRAGGCGVGVDADPGAGQVFGEGGQRGVQPFQGPAERVSQRGRGDRGSGLPAGRGHGGQRPPGRSHQPAARPTAGCAADLNDHLPELDWVDIRERAKAGPIVLTDVDAVPEPRNLRRLKAAIRDRWGTVPLLDMLAETALRTGCLDAFAPVGNRSELAAATLFQRLLLTVYAYGTNTGIRAVAAGDHGHSEDELRYVRPLHINSTRSATDLRTGGLGWVDLPTPRQGREGLGGEPGVRSTGSTGI
jgi:Tn3 transposase DDE domain